MTKRILAALLALTVSTLFSFTRAQDINLTGYTLTFDDEFNSLSVSASNPKGSANWYAGPPNGSPGDFSSSNWNINAFSVSGGILSDEAWYANPAINGQNWQSGLIATVDPSVTGFTQQFGYFEIRCQMPNAGEGAWPAFWLDSTSGITGGQNEEIDIFEWYGVTNTPGSDQDLIQQASHNWNSNGTQNDSLPYLYSPQTAMPDGEYPWQGYHIYGCQVDPVHVTWYIDGVQTNQIATPTSYLTSPFYVMVDYALGGGWPLSGTPFTTDGSSSLLVDWVRVYSLPSGSSNSIGMQFQGQGTALLSTDSAGLSTVAQSNWNVVTGSSFSSLALHDSSGTATTATLSGSANGSYWSGGSSAPPAGNSKLASGEVVNGWPGAPTMTVSNIPYATYDVYVYAGIDASGRAETVSLTPSGGSAQYYSFTTEGGGSAWTAATSTWNGSGTQPSLPGANLVHYTGLTASSFTLAWGAPGNGGLNGIQIVPTGSGTSPPTITTQPANQTVSAGQTATFSVAATGSPTLTYQWSENGTAISGATGSSYTTPATTSANNGSTFSVVVTNPYGNVTSSTATLTVTSSGGGSAQIGMQFQGSGTALLATDSAGLSSVAQTNWNVLTGSSFTNHALSDSTGASTTATLSGSANGGYFAGGSSAPPAGNAKLASGELYNGWPGSPTLTVANIPYATYDVYVYAAIDATGRAQTVSLTPSGGSTSSYSFTTEGGGSAWTVATSTWNGTGTQPSLPSANYVHFTGVSGSSFTLSWGAPGNGGMNGIQIVPVTTTTYPVGVQFQGSGTALLSTDSAGLASVAQTHWNVLTGSSFTGLALSNSSGASTTTTLTGSANGTYFAGNSSAPPAGNAKLASGELFNGWPGSPTMTFSNIPYSNYSVYVYAAIDATGRPETVSLTPSGGTAQYYSFTTEGGGSAWTAATSTWNGTGTQPSLPSANYVLFTGLTSSSFTLSWGAPGNGGMNGVQIVPTP